MKYQILFWRKNNKNAITLLTAELAQIEVKVKITCYITMYIVRILPTLGIKRTYIHKENV